MNNLHRKSYEMKNNCWLFERLSNYRRMAFFGIPFFVLEILTFLHYTNQESDDVVNCATK